MDFVNAAKIIKIYIEKLVKSGKKPAISYIVSKVLSFPPIAPYLMKNFTAQEILEMCYMAFFMIEGDDVKTAEWKSKNQLFLLKLNDIGDIDYIEVDCKNCEGHGNIVCGECDGAREIKCEYCDGIGEIDDEECGECYGDGYLTCGWCGGEGQIECSVCNGSGYLDSDNKYVTLNGEFWITSDVDLADELSSNKYIDNFISGMYNKLDSNSKGLYLLKTISDEEKISIDDFEKYYGVNPVDHIGDYKVDFVSPLKYSSYNPQISNIGSSPTIR